MHKSLPVVVIQPRVGAELPQLTQGRESGLYCNPQLEQFESQKHGSQRTPVEEPSSLPNQVEQLHSNLFRGQLDVTPKCHSEKQSAIAQRDLTVDSPSGPDCVTVGASIGASPRLRGDTTLSRISGTSNSSELQSTNLRVLQSSGGRAHTHRPLAHTMLRMR